MACCADALSLAMAKAYVCPSVRPSHYATLWKRRKLGSRNLLCELHPRL